ncbi:MAG: cupin domain-containing protein [Gammaproteobacteria bacterium]|nr:cupin domain-containing protein [Gammaproteobacteria bacterium]
MNQPIHSLELPTETENSFPEPFKTMLGKSEWRGLSDYFGLSQFGVNLEVLSPNAQSALRHWHTESDEFVFVLEGELTLITNEAEKVLGSGMCAGFKANVENGHHLVNKSDRSAAFIVVGSRIQGDKVHYPDDDFQWLVDESGEWKAAGKDGSLYPS